MSSKELVPSHAANTDFLNSDNLNLKYQWFTTSGGKYIGMRKFKFLAKLNSFNPTHPKTILKNIK